MHFENMFQAYNCQFTGKWQLYGTKPEKNPSNEEILCRSCVNDYEKRKQNYEEMDEKIKTRSYQVPGITKSYNLYEWEKTNCFNPNKRPNCDGSCEFISDTRSL